MESSRLLLAVTVGVLVLTPIASGPIVGGVDLTTSDDGSGPDGTGVANVTVESLATEGIGLQRGRFGSGTYHLDGPSSQIRVHEVRGNPTVKYSLDIPALGHTDSTFYDLGGRSGETVELTLSNYEISPKWVEKNRYDATLVVWIEERGGSFRVLDRHGVTIEVRG